MINRAPIDCSACGRRVVTRTAIGHAASQTHAFVCAGCGVAITYRLTLDQKNVTVSYDPNPINGRWLDDEEGCVDEVVFDPETLGLKEGPPVLTSAGDPPPPGIPRRMSPFMETFGRFRDQELFRRDQQARFAALRAGDVIGRLTTHFEKQNWTLFDAQLKELGMESPPTTAIGRILNLRAVLVDHQALFIKQDRQAALSIHKCFSDAVQANPVLVDRFCDEYRTSKRLHSVWRQLTKFREDFLVNAYHLIPVLQRAYWRPPVPDLRDCVVYNKQFAALKALYIDGFELLARLTVGFLAFSGIAVRGTTDVPTKKGAMDIWTFEHVANANKPTHLTGIPGAAVFTSQLDTLLRNGVGHNSAYFEAQSDAIVLHKQQGAALDEFRYPYTEFVDRVLSMCSALLEADALVFHMLERTRGMIT